MRIRVRVYHEGNPNCIGTLPLQLNDNGYPPDRIMNYCIMQSLDQIDLTKPVPQEVELSLSMMKFKVEIILKHSEHDTNDWILISPEPDISHIVGYEPI